MAAYAYRGPKTGRRKICYPIATVMGFIKETLPYRSDGVLLRPGDDGYGLISE